MSKINIIGKILQSKEVKYNYKNLGYTKIYDTKDITIIENNDKLLYSRWNKVPRKFVIKNREQYKISRLNYLNNRFNDYLNVNTRVLKRSLRFIKEYALPGETVSFKCSINNSNHIKGRLGIL